MKTDMPSPQGPCKPNVQVRRLVRSALESGEHVFTVLVSDGFTFSSLTFDAESLLTTDVIL